MIHLKLMTDDHKKILKNGFREIGDKQYELKFDVYKSITKTSHTQNGLRTLKIQYFS